MSDLYRIKPLQWRHDDWAPTIFGSYTIEQHQGAWTSYIEFDTIWTGTREDALEKAETHYREKVEQCLEKVNE